jgi:pyroglutamyl-peptidase
MIHFGLSQSAKGFCIERSAHNRASPRADAAGALPRGHVILPRGPERLDSPLPASALTAHLKERGIPAAPSRSAGRYLCNFLYYLSLDWATRQEQSPAVLFVHIPPFTTHGGPLAETVLLDGAEAILRFALAFASLEVETLAARGSARCRATL